MKKHKKNNKEFDLFWQNTCWILSYNLQAGVYRNIIKITLNY